MELLLLVILGGWVFLMSEVPLYGPSLTLGTRRVLKLLLNYLKQTSKVVLGS